MEIAYVVKDAKNWEVDPARIASEFDVCYYSGVLEEAWGEASFVFKDRGENSPNYIKRNAELSDFIETK
jgi:hypothetical protein